jgi:antitoxin FitA
MSQLIVRDIAPEVVEALKSRAASHGRSAEAEHREILKQTLLVAPVASLKAMLSNMPNLGKSADFRRPRRTGRKVAL